MHPFPLWARRSPNRRIHARHAHPDRRLDRKPDPAARNEIDGDADHEEEKEHGGDILDEPHDAVFDESDADEEPRSVPVRQAEWSVDPTTGREVRRLELIDLPIGNGSTGSRLTTQSELLVDNGRIYFGPHARQRMDDSEA
jgi:hypothetical protein